MMRTVLGAVLLLLTLALAPQAQAASFACSAATTAFEHAVCDHPNLSRDDDTMATAFATAIGGLSKPMVNAMRADQRAWLDFAARSCSDDSEVLADTARYDKTEQIDCLDLAYLNRVDVLEDSRMIGGHRFAITGRYGALPDPDAASDPDYAWKVATHVLSYPQLDAAGEAAQGFNDFVAQAAADASGGLSDGGAAELDAQSDTSVQIGFDEVVSNRVSLRVVTNWFGHGAAHGNWSVSYLHYLLGADAPLKASDVFTGDTWQQVLTDLSLVQLRTDLGEFLQLDDPSTLTALVTDPSRWSFANESGLTIRFEPYEVASYADGAPAIFLPWGRLSDILAEGADAVRFGS